MSVTGHFGQLRWPDVIGCQVTASYSELRPCRKTNVQDMRVSAFYIYLPMTSGQMTSLPGHFRSPEVHNVISCPWRPPTAVGSEMYSILEFSALYSHIQLLAVKWRHLRDTFGHLRSRDVISCHVTASDGKLQPCRKWYVQYTQVFGLLHPLPGDFRSNDVTFGSLPVTWGHVTSFPATLLLPTARYSLVGSEMYSTGEFLAFHIHFQVTSGQMTSLPGHFR